MKRLAIYALCATLATGVAGSAGAQTIPEGQSCGGLLCDMGVFGHKTTRAPDGARVDLPDPHALPCHDFVCGAFGGRTADETPPPTPAAAPLPDPVATTKKVRKRRVAKAAPMAVESSKDAPAPH